MEWKKIKNNEELVRSTIEKYLEIGKQSIKKENIDQSYDENEIKQEKVRKRALSSDDEHNPQDPDKDNEVVETVIPTFSIRDSTKPSEFNDPTKPWVVRSLERARARTEA